MNLKKQLRALLLLEGLNNFTLASTAWVVLLTARGFSLTEVGIAECIFHVVSLCCEVPSGMIADLLGRRKTLAAGRVAALLSALFMICSASLTGVCVAIGLSALSYNLASGTREAITYDSLLQHGEEPRYLCFSSTMNLVYRLTGAVALLCAGCTVAMGYRAAYGLDMLVHLAAVCVCLALTEPEGAAPEAGVLLGPLLLVAALGGAAGSRLAPLLGRLRYGVAGAVSVAGVLGGVLLVLSDIPVLMALGGFLATAMDDALQLVSDNLLNARIPSHRRATLISVSSMMFSIVMVVLSPWIGQFSQSF